MSKNSLKNFVKLAVGVGGIAFSSVAMSATTIKYAHFQPADVNAPKHAAALAFKDYVEDKTGGEVKVQIYPASQLGNGVEVMEGLKLGTIQLGVVHDGAVAPVYKPFQVFSIPYLFNDQQEAWSVLDGNFGQQMADDMVKKTGIRLMGMADNGIRHFTNSKRPVSSPDDMSDMKIRVQPGPVFQTLVKSLGASPSVVPWPELPGALQQRVVDGQENGVTNIIAASLYQYQKYVTLDGHIYSLHAYMMNNRFFNKLSDSEKSAVTEGLEIAKKIHRDMTSAQDMNAESLLTEKGMEVTVLTDDQKEVFRAKAQPAVKAWAEENVGKQWVDALFSSIDAYKTANQ